jgi:hypothetical protein
MKKDLRDQKQKLRRLGLDRETLRLLDDPALLGLARGELPTDATLSSVVTCTITRPGAHTELC